MAAVWMRFRAELRARWPALLAVALLVGLAGGAALAALAGARRTDTAFDRLVKKTATADLLVNPDNGTDSVITEDDVRTLPQVVQSGEVDGIAVAPAKARTFYDLGALGIPLVSDGKAGYTISRVRMDSGRMPRPTRANEIWVDRIVAKQNDVRVGDHLPVVTFTNDEMELLESKQVSPEDFLAMMHRGEVGNRLVMKVVGVGQVPDSIVVDEGFEAGSTLFSPALLTKHPEVGIGFWGELVDLRRGARDIPAVRTEIQKIADSRTPPDKREAFAFQSLTKTRTKVERAVRPSVGALTVFAVVIALTGVLLVGQALARQTFLDANDNDALRALGTTRGQLFSTAMLRAAVIAFMGAAFAVVLAIVLSPLTPIGVARSIDPDPGIDVARAIMVFGFMTTVGVVLLLALWPAWRSARAHASDAVTVRPSRVVTVVSESGLSVPAAAGVRMALEPGRGRTAVPVRTTIIGAGLAIATVIAAGVFAASLDHLVSTPKLFGWNWDTQISVSPDAPPDQIEAARDSMVDLLDSSPAVARWGTVSLSDLTLARSPIAAVGIDRQRGAALPTLVDGTLPKRSGEIALGHLTMRDLGVGIGDTVVAHDLQGKPVRLKVVGTVVLPGLGTYPGADKTSLGEGAVLTREQLYDVGPNFGQDDFVVAFDDAATARDRKAVLTQAEKIVSDLDPEGFEAAGVQRPSDIVAYDRVRSTPLVLALVLALLATATVAHALISAVRRRRRDLALLATLGLTRRQVSSTVAWQSTTVGVLALVIGVPLGIIGGRWAWGLLADDLGTLSEPKVPILAIVVGIPVVLLLCNAVAYIPGRIAARMKPAAVLRSE